MLAHRRAVADEGKGDFPSRGNGTAGGHTTQAHKSTLLGFEPGRWTQQGEVHDEVEESLLEELQSALDVAGVDLSASEVLVEFTERFGSSGVAMQRLKEFCSMERVELEDSNADGDGEEPRLAGWGSRVCSLSLFAFLSV